VDEPVTKKYFNLHEEWLLSGHYHLTEAVHVNGAKIGIQLGHVGVEASLYDYGGKQPLSPSGIQQFDVSKQPFPMPRAMTRVEIYQLIEYFAIAAANAKRAGYDLVELHGAHGYLLNAFMSPAMNKRTDEFGGSLENRLRFPVEIIEAIHQLAGDDYPVGIRINADDFIPGGITTEESPAMAKMLEEAGAAYINVAMGTYASHWKMNDVMRMEEGWKLPIWATIKEAVTIPTIAGGGNRHAEFCERIIAEGKADFVGMARQMLTDPYWSKKVSGGKLENINHCISCLRCLFAIDGGPQVVRHCTVNAMWGREVEYTDYKPAAMKKKVMIIGGGVAGMEAARVASLRGHAVTLHEKGQELGGQLLIASIPPGKQKVLWLRDYLVTQIKKQGVNLKLGSEVTPDTVNRVKPDVVILAIGAQPLVLDIPGIKGTRVVTAWDILRGKLKPKGQNIVILGGGIVGCETAEFLVKSGNKVTIIEMLPKAAQDMESINRRILLDELEECKVTILTRQKVVEVTDEGTVIANTISGERQLITADRVVVALGSVPVRSLAEALEDKVDELYLIGDCQRARTILEAVADGFLIGHKI
jgi:2,4-dienoyl-CoA reductase-like NADH-dependent reductase (Old Yellow Enzyme family)/thioredoxin reductase